MAVDRVRRDALANLLLRFLRGETGVKEFSDLSDGIFRAKANSISGQEGFHGFPVIVEGASQKVVDPVLDDHLPGVIWFAVGFVSSRKEAVRNRAWGELVRTLMLLRTDLDGEDLALPRRPTVQRLAFFKLALISTAAFISTLIIALILAPWIGPFGFLLWPLFGVSLAFWHPMLFRARIKDDARSRPFLYVVQYDSSKSLIASDERASFKLDRRTDTGISAALLKSRWRYVYLPFGVILWYVMIVVAIGVFGSLFLVIWPFFMFDQIREAKRRLNA